VTSGLFRSRLAERAAAAAIDIGPDLAERLDAYYRLLSVWNAKINLTALDLQALPDGAVDRLFIEPVAAARFSQLERRVLDIGSGGGSPAIPFALATQAMQLTMVESRSRKAVFLKEAARVVGLSGVTVTNARFENVTGDSDVESAFDVITIRAVRIGDPQWALLRTALTNSGVVFLFHQPGLNVSGPSGFTDAAAHQLTDHGALSVFHVKHSE
jgi:16S rRNA (guanine527-N7)-methyltransferase